MSLCRLDVSGVRNLESLRLEDLTRVNVFFGSNGSGKTSLLESIYLLGMGRSFRTSQIKSVINLNSNVCTVYGEVTIRPSGGRLGIGVSRDRFGAMEAKVGGERVSGRAALAATLPLQLMDAESFDIIAGSPVHRRQFLDWGVFHVEHQFFGHWQDFQRAIKQRNSLLRRGKISRRELLPWDREVSIAGRVIDSARARYLEALSPVFQATAEELSPGLERVELRYRRGWDKAVDLEVALAQSFETDSQQGFTHVGPQRADIRILLDGKPAAELMSRGQQKLTVCALKLAQAKLMAPGGQGLCTFLVDDLTSELDARHCGTVAEQLAGMNAQVFITCIEQSEALTIWPLSNSDHELAMFHVEHGRVSRHQG